MEVLDAATRAAIVDRVAETVQEIYVFPEVAVEMADHLRQRLRDGAYGELGGSVETLTQQLTVDLLSICHDRHLLVQPIVPRDVTTEQTFDEERHQRRFLSTLRARNYGFERLEILAGNIGYLDLRNFSPAEHAGTTADAALALLSNADALILDLRKNVGGEPSMVQLIASYFFGEPVHLSTIYDRRTDTRQQLWTQAHVNGPRLSEIPIWVLTSGRTFSAAEELTYDLKHLERATVVGETTGGGAHPIDQRHFPELGVQVCVPYGRTINAITGTNWEGAGVEPHVGVAADEALTVAHRRALAELAEAAKGDPERERALAWDLDRFEADLRSVVLEPGELESYAGIYGPYAIRLEAGRLTYQHNDRPRYRLLPMGESRFALEGRPLLRVRFERDASNHVTVLVNFHESGREERSPRTGE